MGESSDIVVIEPDTIGSFSDPRFGGIERMTQIAETLDNIIRECGLSVRMGNGEHLKVEAWCALGSMVGVSPRTVWTKVVEGDVFGVISRVEVVRLSTGEIIGAAEAACYADEKNKRKDGSLYQRWIEHGSPNRHAILSMSQTRATSKALGQVLRFIPVLAGYSGTPAEEMPEEASGEVAPIKVAAPANQSGGREASVPPPARSATVPQGLPPATPPGAGPWLDEAIKFGKFKGRRWRELAEGKPDGQRASWLEFMRGKLKEGLDSGETKYQKQNEEQLRRVEYLLTVLHGRAPSPEPPKQDPNALAPDEQIKYLRGVSEAHAANLIGVVLGDASAKQAAALVRAAALKELGISNKQIPASAVDALEKAILRVELRDGTYLIPPAGEDALEFSPEEQQEISEREKREAEAFE